MQQGKDLTSYQNMQSNEEIKSYFLSVWDGIYNGSYTTKEMMQSYDVAFKLCNFDRSDVLYNILNEILYEKSLIVTTEKHDKEKYMRTGELFCRVGAHLDRFYIYENNLCSLPGLLLKYSIQ